MAKSDPAAVCPNCRGRLRVMSSRRSAGGVLTRYRVCGCGTRTVDRARVVVTAIGLPRVLSETRVSESADLTESEDATVPTSAT